jgi:hypothetical protein
VTTRTHVGFYNKAGQLQQPEVFVGDLFAPLHLDRLMGASPTFFDTRSLFDSYRKRFWVGALAIKHWPDSSGAVPADNLTKFVAAVSLTENPQDGFYLYWWDAVASDGNTSSGVFQTGDWGDYPTLGVDGRCIYQTNGVRNAGRSRYCHVIFFPADDMAAGRVGPIAGWQYWDLKNPDGSNAGGITPTVHHGANSRGFLAGPNLGSTMLVWGIQDPLGPGQRIDRAELAISNFNGPLDAPQKGSAQLIRTTNVGTDPLRASCRKNLLSFSFNDGSDWGRGAGIVSSNRVLAVDVSRFPLLPAAGDPGYRERLFGFNNPIEDGPNDRFSYAWPVVDMNANGDLVLVYSRAGVTRDPEIRFSTWLGGESDIRPSRLLKGGEQPYALSWVPKTDSLPWADTAGISVDPYDDTAIWIAHAYADSHTKDGNYSIWVGKVFGLRRPWWKVRLQLVSGPGHVGPGDPVEVLLQVENGGDGESPSSRAHVELISDPGATQRLLSVRVPAIKPGACVTLRLVLHIPAEARGDKQEIRAVVDPHQRTPQYSRVDNTACLSIER